MGYWSQNTTKKKQFIRWMVIMVLGIGAVPFLIYFFPHALNKQHLFEVEYFRVNDQSRVITIYYEQGNSEDGNYLTGYWLYLLDPTTNKELDKIFVKRSKDNVPSNPEIYFIGEKEIWIIGRPYYANEEIFQTIVEINNDKFNLASTDFLNGWKLGTVDGDRIGLSNQYNEPGCLDVHTRKITNEICPYHESNSTPPVQTSFFFVKNTPTSTRCKLYCYSTSEIFPPPGIFSGMLPADGTIPGWHLMDAVNMSNGNLDEPTVNAYRSKFEKTENLVVVNQNQLFNSPRIICSNDSICTLTCLSDDGKTNCFHQYSSSGKLVWKVDCPSLKTNTSIYGMKGRYTLSETILIHPENWVLSIDNSNGKIKWQCPK